MGDFYATRSVVFEAALELFDDIDVEASAKTGIGRESDDGYALTSRRTA